MKVVLMDRGYWSFIIGEDKPCPEQATEKEKFEYDWRKQRCYTTIYQGIERKFLPLIRHRTDGKEAWKILKTNFEPTSKARLAVLIDEFFDLKFNPEEGTTGIFCKRVEEKKIQVKEAGFEIPELLIALQLIRRLPAEYDHLVQTLYRLKDEKINHREVEKQLVNEDGRIQLKQKDLNLDYTENAYTVGSFRLQETRKKSFERSAAVLDPSRNPGQYRTISYPKGMGPFCDFCSRKEHDASKCYKKRNKEKKQAFASETSFCRTNQAFGVWTDWDQFLIDTAATSHFCYERDWFKNFKELTTTKALLADKKSTCEVKGIGDIDFIVKDIKGWNHAQIDIKGAYLYGNLDIPIYMQKHEEFAVKGCEHYVCRLHQSIYGLHQSGRQWNIELNEILFGLGFHQNELCNGLYTKSNCILLVYVDDIVVFSKSQSDLENLILNIKIKLEIRVGTS
ncbi:hypothetical protein AVEN_8704-1 [Araneus ventricosus]|uniref:Reverse transcriptase Ty1/copia-type domain-containing protein n=1 Tax=Araneus ventricosus TaxID=182803 RepID=A0A4Y2GEN1_ARAVE|nr:hypothetical protein AVEN_8704-1 [Araneus ventricosus]